MRRLKRMVIKLWHCLNLLLRIEGYKRAEYIRKHNLFGSMGENCYFHPFMLPGDPKHIFIGNNVKIAAGVTFINHDIANAMLNTKNNTEEFKYYLEPIHIRDNVVVGTNTTILPGRTIGSNCVVGAGSVVSRDIPDNSVAVGNPARVIRSFEEFENARRAYGKEE